VEKVQRWTWISQCLPAVCGKSFGEYDAFSHRFWAYRLRRWIGFSEDDDVSANTRLTLASGIGLVHFR